MKQIMIIKWMLLLLLISQAGMAQEYKANLASGTLKFDEVGNLSVEGYNGQEVVITYTGKRDIPERAKGLKPINSLGLEDNTGIGLSVSDSGDVMAVQPVSRQAHEGYYQVKVPANVKVQISYTGVEGKDVRIKNLDNEIEVSTRHNGIVLENVSGPALINSVAGTVTATFSAIQPDTPVSIISMQSDVDVALPAGTKADLTLSSRFGTIYTDMDIAYAKASGDMRRISSEIEGTLNGGGSQIILKSYHSNVYLRKK